MCYNLIKKRDSRVNLFFLTELTMYLVWYSVHFYDLLLWVVVVPANCSEIFVFNVLTIAQLPTHTYQIYTIAS